MENFATSLEPFFRLIAPFFLITLRYFLFAGTAYFIFYHWKKHKWLHRKIQKKFPEKKAIIIEIRNSIRTALIFTIVGGFVFYLSREGYTKIYRDINEHGWLYFFISIPLMILMHDTYFYWTHRFMHHPKIFFKVHKVHHLSHNPTPWAAFSFHPVEAVIEAGILPVIVFTIPAHPLALFCFMLFMIVLNVIGHLGFELFPKNFLRNPVMRWQNSSTHHNMHHRLTKGNYGLYFNFWDRIMGTNHKNYYKEFEEVTTFK